MVLGRRAQGLIDQASIKVVSRQDLFHTGAPISGRQAAGGGQGKALVGEEALLGELIEQARHHLFIWLVL
jgi:hypothetical protein